MNRPRKHDRKELARKFADYIAATDIPIVARFAADHGISKDLVYDWPEFSSLIKQCVTKKEAALEEKALAGEISIPMAIFSLKQLGWRDRQEISGDPEKPLLVPQWVMPQPRQK